MSPWVVPVFRSRIASKVIGFGLLEKCQIWFHSMTRAGEPANVVNLPRTIGLPALLKLLPIQSSQSGAIAAWGGEAVRSALEKPELAAAKLSRAFELAKSWLFPVTME